MQCADLEKAKHEKSKPLKKMLFLTNNENTLVI